MDYGVINETDGNKIPSDNVHSDNINRNMATATGTVNYIGFGFKPSRVITFMSVQGTSQCSWSTVTEDLEAQCIYGTSSVGIFTGNNVNWVRADNGANDYEGDITSLDADGFTVDWTRTGTPTGTIQARIMAYK
jgi:hypothetical protein